MRGAGGTDAPARVPPALEGEVLPAADVDPGLRSGLGGMAQATTEPVVRFFKYLRQQPARIASEIPIRS